MSSNSDLLLNRSDSAKTNTDVSECSTTNTEDYATCTDTSRRVPGTTINKPASSCASSSSTTQVPGSRIPIEHLNNKCIINQKLLHYKYSNCVVMMG